MTKLNQILKTAFLSGALLFSPLVSRVPAQDRYCSPIDSGLVLRDYEVADYKGVRSIISGEDTNTELSLPTAKNPDGVNIMMQYSNKEKFVIVNVIGSKKEKRLSSLEISTINKVFPDSLSSAIKFTPDEIPSAVKYRIKSNRFGMFDRDPNSGISNISTGKMVECLTDYGNSVLRNGVSALERFQ